LLGGSSCTKKTRKGGLGSTEKTGGETSQKISNRGEPALKGGGETTSKKQFATFKTKQLRYGLGGQSDTSKNEKLTEKTSNGPSTGRETGPNPKLMVGNGACCCVLVQTPTPQKPQLPPKNSYSPQQTKPPPTAESTKTITLKNPETNLVRDWD